MHSLINQWIETEHVSVDVHNLNVLGDAPLIGSLHIVSETQGAPWICSVVAPSPYENRVDFDLQAFSISDRLW